MLRIYMLRIADQKAGLIGLKFFVDTHGGPEGAIGENSKFFFNIFFSFFHGQRWALQLVLDKINPVSDVNCVKVVKANKLSLRV